jgi:uncharacterized surface protein with fasciclin (FAS1) repeats
MNRKKSLTLILIALLVLVLAACAPTVESNPTVEAPPTEFTNTNGNANANMNANENGNMNENTNANSNANANDNTSGAATEEQVTTDTLATITSDPRFIQGFGFLLGQAVNANMIAVDLANDQFTVFVPDNTAWAGVSAADAAVVTTDAAKAQAFFGCYVAEGAMSQADLASAGSVKTVSGDTITVGGNAGSLMLNSNVHITSAIKTSNGYIYTVDGLLCQPGQ